MSRHSKWAKIKHQKGAADVKKGSMFTKCSRTITMAARDGGDPAMNFKLRLAIDQAKEVGMPKDTVDRAIARGAGVGKDGIMMSEEMFEGFLPGGVAVVIEVVTDNHNRSLQELKHEFSEHGGNLGGAGSVAWMFGHKGVLRVSNEKFPKANRDEIELQLIDAGVEDLQEEDEGFTITTASQALKVVEEKLRALHAMPEYVALEWVPKERVPIAPDRQESVDHFINLLEEREDVSNVYTNV